MPSLLIKTIAPYFIHRVPYYARVTFCAAMSFSAVTVSSNTIQDKKKQMSGSSRLLTFACLHQKKTSQFIDHCPGTVYSNPAGGRDDGLVEFRTGGTNVLDAELVLPAADGIGLVEWHRRGRASRILVILGAHFMDRPVHPYYSWCCLCKYISISQVGTTP